MTLYSGSSSKPSVLIQPNGKYLTIGSNYDFLIHLILGGITENFEFKINDDTDAYGSCSATLNGEFYVFGSYHSSGDIKKQVIVIHDS